MNYFLSIIFTLNTIGTTAITNLPWNARHNTVATAVKQFKTTSIQPECNSKYDRQFYSQCGSLYLKVNRALVKAEYDKCLEIYRVIEDVNHGFSECEEPFYQIVKAIYNCQTNFNGNVYVNFSVDSRIDDRIYNIQYYKCVASGIEKKTVRELKIKWIDDRKIIEQYQMVN